ncbi:MAG TPA: hypothetical protein VL947_03670 [Cytophagales bacterium]|nr:hypothetical protein [Cytophagales bacterium]
MKKLILSSAVLAAFLSANAQEALTTPTVGYKPAAGNAVIELGLSGGLLNTATSLNSPGNGAFPGMVKLRYFLADDLALRASFNFSAYSTTNKAYELDDDGKETETVGTQKIRNSFYGVNLGVEKHFTGTERLSTYIGGDLSLGVASASLKEEKYNGGAYNEDYSRTIKGANGPGGDNGGFGWGLRAVTGADYYFVKKVYLGAEAGWGFFSFRNSGVKTTTTTPDGTGGTDTVTSETKSDGGAFTLTPQVVASVRIGYIF